MISHALAKNLPKEAVTADWERFNGQNDEAYTPETKVNLNWGESGPDLLWELEKGDGYSSPIISGGTVVLFHRLNGLETIEGRDSETGELNWTHAYPVEYKDRYGYLNGPRASPVVFDGLLYAHGVTAWLTCLELKTGKLIWKRDLAKDLEYLKNFSAKDQTH